MTTRQAYASLRSIDCPACGRRKKPDRSLCVDCYYLLPQSMRQALYQPMRSGYERALAAALDRLAIIPRKVGIVEAVFQDLNNRGVA